MKQIRRLVPAPGAPIRLGPRHLNYARVAEPLDDKLPLKFLYDERYEDFAWRRAAALRARVYTIVADHATRTP